MREVAAHTTDYIDAATTGILSPHMLLVKDLRIILPHIEETLPSTMHLLISSDDALHFYRYLCTHILIADEHFLLLIDVPIQDQTQQMEIYEVFNLDIPHRISQHTMTYKTAVPLGITLICPGEAPRSFRPQTPIHVL